MENDAKQLKSAVHSPQNKTEDIEAPASIQPRYHWRWLILVGVLSLAVPLAAALIWFNFLFPTPEKYRFATGSTAGVYDNFGNLFVDAMKDFDESIVLEVTESAGSKDNARRLEEGECHFALLQNDTSGQRSIRSIAVLYEETLHLVCRKEANIQTLADLDGKVVAVGEESSGTYSVANALLDFVLGDNLAVKRLPLSTVDTQNRLLSGEIDAAFFVFGLRSKSLLDLLKDPSMQLLPIMPEAGSDVTDDNSAMELVEGFRTIYPYVEAATVPMKTYGDLPVRALPTLSISAVLVCRDDVPRSVVSQVTHLLFKDKAELAKQLPLIAGLNESNATKGLQFSVHEGADDYYRRREPGFLAEHAESMGFVLTLILLGWSAISGITSLRRKEAKDQIDQYYQRVLVIHDRIHDCKTEEARVTLHAELVAIERESKLELIGETLRPDNSFVVLQNMLASSMDELRPLNHPTEG